MYPQYTYSAREDFIKVVDECQETIIAGWQCGLLTKERVSDYVFALARKAGEAGYTKHEITYAAIGLHLLNGYSLRFICETIQNRLQEGHTFRAALLWSYKAGRR